MIVIGVDPGAGGALCLLCRERGILDIVDVPTVVCRRKSGKEYCEVDLYALANLLDNWTGRCHIDRAAIEAVTSRPSDGHVGAFSFGHSYGALRMALASHFIPCVPVDTATWRKGVGIPSRTTKGDKAPVVARADSIWPDHKHLWRGPRGGIRADRAEAALIAKFADWDDHGWGNAA